MRAGSVKWKEPETARVLPVSPSDMRVPAKVPAMTPSDSLLQSVSAMEPLAPARVERYWSPFTKTSTEGGSAEGSYYTWVDQFDTLGLGANVPINTGNASEGLLALKDGKWVVLRVPYPQGFYTKWMDGRIDDPKAGWKGKGVWATVSTRAPFHMETGKGTQSKVMHFQIRPDPLAK